MQPDNAPVWAMQKIRRLESELRRSKEQLADFSRNNANERLITSKIYNIVKLAAFPSTEIQEITRIIEENNAKMGVVAESARPTSSTHAGSATTSPTTNIDDSDDSEPRESKSSGMNSGQRALVSPGWASEDDDVTDADPSRQTKAEKQNAGDGGARATIEDTWNEFSLEEEMAGIAAAPEEARPAMRAALQSDAEARLKQMKDSAEEKRITAEREGLLLRARLQETGSRQKPAASPAVTIAMPSTKQDGQGGQGDGNPSRDPRRPVCVDSDDDDDTCSTSSIVSIDVPSPKMADRFGIVFDPSTVNADLAAAISGAPESSDMRRSIIIQNIPQDFTIHKLLAHVRGGTVATARLIPDTLNTGHGQMALITFKTAQEARCATRATAEIFARAGTSEHLASGAETRVCVSLLPTPTYPSSDAGLAGGGSNSNSIALPTNEEPTRCLFVESFPRNFIHSLCTELLLTVGGFPTKLATLEEMWFTADETLRIQFTSIQEAVKAHRIISIFHFGKYSAQVHFGADPCAGPFDDVADVFHNGTAKLASHGHMGLKSLLETVGLAAYSRSQKKTAPTLPRSGDRAGVPASVHTLKTATRSSAADAGMCADNGAGKTDNRETCVLIDLSAGSTDAGSKSELVVPDPLGSTGSLLTSITPWTEELMEGLDRL